ncbi:MAG TPA: methyltransferase domain-containing protein, partial [Thermodesulfatator sp.]|nr:methyltransferase domain-containing protein [Thermodesulfatator sp.]
RSAWAISQARLAARRNGLEVQFLQEDVFSFLRRPQRPFDVVIVDPPALIKKRSHLAAGLRNYRRLNHLAIKALKPGGLLISCSCSHHLSLQEHQHLVQQAAQGLLRPARLLEIRGQSPDHPVLLSMPETAYLKCLLIRV